MTKTQTAANPLGHGRSDLYRTGSWIPGKWSDEHYRTDLHNRDRHLVR